MVRNEVGKLTGARFLGLEMHPTSSFRQWEAIPRPQVHRLECSKESLVLERQL
jgi:hypothetical protein